MVQELFEHQRVDPYWAEIQTLGIALKLGAMYAIRKELENYLEYVVEPQRERICKDCKRTYLRRSPSRADVYVCTTCHRGFCRSRKHNYKGVPGSIELVGMTRGKCNTCIRIKFLRGSMI